MVSRLQHHHAAARPHSALALAQQVSQDLTGSTSSAELSWEDRLRFNYETSDEGKATISVLVPWGGLSLLLSFLSGFRRKLKGILSISRRSLAVGCG